MKNYAEIGFNGGTKVLCHGGPVVDAAKADF
jgi:hypothetical protein